MESARLAICAERLVIFSPIGEADLCDYRLDTDEEWTKPTVSLPPPAAYSFALSGKRRVLCFGAAAEILAVVGKGSPMLFCVIGFLLTVLLG